MRRQRPSSTAAPSNNLTGSSTVTLSTQMLQSLFDMLQGGTKRQRRHGGKFDLQHIVVGFRPSPRLSTATSTGAAPTQSGSVTLSTQTLQALFDLLQNGNSTSDDLLQNGNSTSDPDPATAQQASSGQTQGAHHHHHHHSAPPPADAATTASTASDAASSTTGDATASGDASTDTADTTESTLASALAS